jgi:hypothetical protein
VVKEISKVEAAKVMIIEKEVVMLDPQAADITETDPNISTEKTLPETKEE